MIRKAGAVFFLSPIVGRLTTPVPRTVIADCGVHLMLYTKETGLTAVRKKENNKSSKFQYTTFPYEDRVVLR